MTYTIDLTPTADAELLSAMTYIYEDAPENAIRWLRDIQKAIASLEQFPARCPIAPESEHLGEILRHFIFKSHRIIFFIDEPKKTVRVLHIRHGAMRGIGETATDNDN